MTNDPITADWCSRINAAWDKYGDGKPLEPAIVESMAMAFSQQPHESIVSSLKAYTK